MSKWEDSQLTCFSYSGKARNGGLFQASERQEVSEKHTKPNMQVQKQTFMNDLIFHMQAAMLYKTCSQS